MSEEEGWCPIFYSNHDTTRTVSRIGSEEFSKESATMLATIQMTHKGTPFIYNGDEIGMTNANDFNLEDYRDVAVFNKYKDFVESGLVKEEYYLLGLKYTSRDNNRTPMQWNEEVNSGFTTSIPWIRVNSNYKEINVDKQSKDPNSVVNYYRGIIALRKNNPLFIYGDFRKINKEHKNVY